jgi:hypothetical protein
MSSFSGVAILMFGLLLVLAESLVCSIDNSVGVEYIFLNNSAIALHSANDNWVVISYFYVD